MLKRLKDLFTDSATYGLSHVLYQVINFVLLPFYTRVLTTSDYGVMAMLGIIHTLFVPIGNIGLSNAIFRQYNLKKDDDHIKNVTGTGLISIFINSLFLLILGEVFVVPITELLIGDAQYVLMARLAVFTGFLMSIARIPQVILRAKRRVKTIAILNIVKILVTLPTIIYLILFKGMGLYGVVVGELIGEFLYICILTYYSRDLLSFNFSSSVFKAMLKYGLPFLPKQLQLVGLAFFGQFVVRDLLGLEQTGLYSMAMRFALPVNMMVSVIGRAWEPLKFQIHAEDSEPSVIFASIVNYFVPAYFYTWVGLSLWGNDVLKLMTASEFHSAAYLIPFVTMIFVTIGVYQLLSTGIAFADNMIPLPLIQLVGTIVVVIGSYIVIPVLGALGAALITTAGWVIISVLALKVAQRRLRIDYDWHYLTNVTILTLLFIAAGYYVHGMETLNRITLLTLLTILYPLLILLALTHSRLEGERVRRGLAMIKARIIGA